MLRKALYSAYSLLAKPTIEALENASRNPRKAQASRLSQILGNNSSTVFGKEHRFQSISSGSDYARAVPIRDYEEFRPYIEPVTQGQKNILTAEDPFMFATTSGTTGQPKYVPITDGFMHEYRQASIVSGYLLYKYFPGIARGMALSMISPAEEGRLESGIPYGAMTGAIYQKEPLVVKKFIAAIPYEASLINDYESRYYTILRIAIENPISLFYTPNPSTISLLARRLKQYAQRLIADLNDGTLTPPSSLPQTIKDAIMPSIGQDRQKAARLSSLLETGKFTPENVWPELAVISCWTKAAASFYLQDFPEYFGATPISDITYGASEGRGTVFLAPDKQILALNSHYYEFVPEDEIDSACPTVLQADELSVGSNYFILFTTSGGLYRYNLNDVIKVTGYYNKAPLIEFQHKGGNIFSFTGEKITESQVTAAMRRVLHKSGQKLRFFTVIPQFRPEAHYQIWVEPETTNQSGDKDWHVTLAGQFDIELACQNIEYKAKRASMRLSAIEAQTINPGTYESLRKHLSANGTPDAQIKLSHLNPKDEIRSYLERNIRKEVGVA